MQNKTTFNPDEPIEFEFILGPDECTVCIEDEIGKVILVSFSECINNQREVHIWVRPHPNPRMN